MSQGGMIAVEKYQPRAGVFGNADRKRTLLKLIEVIEGSNEENKMISTMASKEGSGDPLHL